MSGQTLGSHLRALRLAAGLSLRAVQDKTSGRVKNGYLSQIEGGDIKSPSPSMLNDLAQVYGVDYGDLLTRAGHPVPVSAKPGGLASSAIAGIPRSAFTDLTEQEAREVIDFLAFVKSRRATGSKS